MNNQKIINDLLKNFEDYFKLLKKLKYSKILSDWKKNSFLGSKVKIRTINKTFEGTAFDVDNKGNNITLREGEMTL